MGGLPHWALRAILGPGWPGVSGRSDTIYVSERAQLLTQRPRGTGRKQEMAWTLSSGFKGSMVEVTDAGMKKWGIWDTLWAQDGRGGRVGE